LALQVVPHNHRRLSYDTLHNNKPLPIPSGPRPTSDVALCTRAVSSTYPQLGAPLWHSSRVIHDAIIATISSSFLLFSSSAFMLGFPELRLPGVFFARP